MKRIIAMLLALVMVFALAACGNTTPAATEAATTEPATTAAPETEPAKDLGALVSAETPDLMLYVDGADVTDGNVKFEQIADKFEEVELDGVHYYATSVKNLCAYDLSSVQSFFGETSDGFVRYYKDLENAYIAVLQSEDGENYTQIENEGAPTYAMILPEGNKRCSVFSPTPGMLLRTDSIWALLLSFRWKVIPNLWASSRICCRIFRAGEFLSINIGYGSPTL